MKTRHARPTIADDEWRVVIEPCDMTLVRWKIYLESGVMRWYPPTYALTLKAAQRKGHRLLVNKTRKEASLAHRQALADRINAR